MIYVIYVCIYLLLCIIYNIILKYTMVAHICAAHGLFITTCDISSEIYRVTGYPVKK